MSASSNPSRDKILNKLRSVRRPFEDAPPRPAKYHPVTVQQDESPEALLERFKAELTNLKAEVYVADGDDAARDQVMALLEEDEAKRIIAWDFKYVPVAGLEAAIRAAQIEIVQPEVRDEFRAETLATAESAQVGITGADAAAATTGTMVFTTTPGKGRIPTILPPIHIAILSLDQVLPRLESWVARLRANDLSDIRNNANFCFISGPSRTGDIEMEMVFGAHGPRRMQVIIKR